MMPFAKGIFMRKIEPAKAHYTGLDQRSAPRSDVYVRMPIVLPDGLQDVCTIVNISADGLLIRFSRTFETGETLMFRLPVIGTVQSQVIWSTGGKTGVQFIEMIQIEDYLPLLRSLGIRPPEQ